MVTLPCAMATAHGKVTKETLFFCFLGLKDPTPTYINTYITNNMQDIIYHNKYHSITTYKASNSQVRCKCTSAIESLKVQWKSTSPMQSLQVHKCTNQQVYGWVGSSNGGRPPNWGGNNCYGGSVGEMPGDNSGVFDAADWFCKKCKTVNCRWDKNQVLKL